MMSNPFAIAVHGGAGTILRSLMSPEKESLYRGGLTDALRAGEKILSAGGSALDAVEAAVMSLENNPLFNAGKGSVFNHEGKHEMDASVMEGRELKAGAVAGVSGIKNPVSLARAVMERSPHVLMAGEGAHAFARSLGVEFEDDAYFFDTLRHQQFLEAQNEGRVQLDHSQSSKGEGKKFGTVGAVALDRNGDLAAATSTGGMTNKRFGRIGDSPLIGAGTYANNKTCAVSCTGHGEYFIRSVVAYDISCLIEYKGMSLKEACDCLVHDKLIKIGGEGGLIALDAQGHIEMPFNSEGMYRGKIAEGSDPVISIYKE